MDYRRASRIAEVLLVAVVVMLHVGIFIWPELRGRPNYLVSAVHDAQLLSGSMLILGWCLLGPGSIWLRGAALPVLSILWVLPWNERMLPRATAAEFPFLIAAAAALAVITLRLCGLRMRRLDPAAGPERGAQFSLLGLLIATTLIAAAIGGLEALRPTISRDRGVEYLSFLGEMPRAPQQARQLVLAISVALASLGGLWVVTRPGAMWFRLGAMFLALPLLAYYLAQLASQTDEGTTVAVNLAVGLGLVAGLTGLTVLPLRLLDYRLMRAEPAPAFLSASPVERRSLTSRSAAIASVLAAVSLLPVSLWVSGRSAQRLSPPAASFAEWIQPRQRYRIYSVQIRWAALNQQLQSIWQIEQNTTKVNSLPPLVLETHATGEINGWEYRRSIEVLLDDGSNKSVKVHLKEEP